MMATIEYYLLRGLIKSVFPVLFFVLFWCGALAMLTNGLAILVAASMALVYGLILDKLIRWEPKVMARIKTCKG